MALEVFIKNKSYSVKGRDEAVVNNLTFRLEKGEIGCLAGPSGCGKTTALKIIVGLDTDYQGEILLDGKKVTKPSQDIGMVVQTQVCFDWMTVGENISFGMKYRRDGRHPNWLLSKLGWINEKLASEELLRIADLVGLSGSDLTKNPQEISGGMKQRMAFGRALVTNPKVLALDEPFSSLDFESRQALQDVVLNVRKELGVTFLCVSHDPEEALYLSDQIIFINANERDDEESVVRPLLPQKGMLNSRFTEEFQVAKRSLMDRISTDVRRKTKG